MPSYLIYHPTRNRTAIGEHIVYHDGFGAGNSDPYDWNERFLHSFCHINQMRLSAIKEGDINFWVSGTNLRRFTELRCDLVFVVGVKVQWRDRDSVRPNDVFVDSRRAYDEHYLPGCNEHHRMGNRRHRFTLKADPERSFQPQDERRELLDIVPTLLRLGIPLDTLRQEFDGGRNSKPMIIDDRVAAGLYDYLSQAARRLSGEEIAALYPFDDRVGDSSHCSHAPVRSC